MVGLHLNYSKSSIITWCSENEEYVNDIARLIGCKIEKCTITYLGLTIGENMNRIKA